MTTTPKVVTPTPIPGWGKRTSPYHAGEQSVQERAGARDFAERMGRQVIRSFMTDQHREFYEMLSVIFVGTLDKKKRPWASVLFGRPGFVRATDPTHLVVRARPPLGDPMLKNLQAGAPVGMVGVQLETRRRNRVNGWVSQATADGFELEVSQSFGNCPQYIQARHPLSSDDLTAAPQGQPEVEGVVLSSRAIALIGKADTFFVASASPDAGASDPVEGADVNHRGGRPGFVRVHEEQGRSVITWPDFVGNSAFNTLGNILLNPVAGLLFVDFQSGDVLSLTGAAQVLWDAPEATRLQGAERLVRLSVDEGIFIKGAIPGRWGEPEYASQLPQTGIWADLDKLPAAGAAADAGYRPYVIRRIEKESSTVSSFYLQPDDGLGLPPHRAGQFLPISIRLGNDSPELRRTYTISNEPGLNEYRLSIKRETRADGSLGVASHWFHDSAEVGTRIQAMRPRGEFVLDAESQRPVVLISAGIGITPMIAMVEYLTSAHTERPRFPDRRVWFLHFVRNGTDHAFGAHLRSLVARRSFETARGQRSNLVTCIRYSEPRNSDVPGTDFDGTGVIDAALVKDLLPFDDYDFYLCGPPGFMQSAYDILLGLGARDERISAESFGPASLQRRTVRVDRALSLTPAVDRAVIRFQRSGKQLDWTPSMGPVLDAAEAAGLNLPWSCRSGSCGTCRAPVVSGRATYAMRPSASIDDASALLCCALPATSELIVDA